LRFRVASGCWDQLGSLLETCRLITIQSSVWLLGSVGKSVGTCLLITIQSSVWLLGSVGKSVGNLAPSPLVLSIAFLAFRSFGKYLRPVASLSEI